jgi:putative ABC transport system permease protein
MKRNFIKIALRYLWRNRSYSLLNFACLTFGISCSILALLFILNALSFDKFHTNYNRLYEVESYVTYFNGDRFAKEYLSASLNEDLKQQAPEIEELTRVTNRSYDFVYGDKTFNENGIYADNNFFKLFTFPILEDNASKKLEDNNSILISERMAQKFFGKRDCIGQTLIMKDDNRQEAFTIQGILKNVPSQSMIQFDYILPFSKFLSENNWANDQGAAATQIWTLLKENSSRSAVETKIKNLIKNQEANLNQELFLFPLGEKLLYRYVAGKRVWDEMQNLVIVGSIAFAILLIACFNYINMAIALNIKRYKEAGIKKVVGSSKGSIVAQFMGETFLLTLFSLITAILLAKMLVHGFNTAFQQEIHFSLLNLKVLSFSLLITLFTGLLSGIFPSLYLSTSNPLNVLKGKITTSNSYSLFRQGLIVFQFTIPVILIVAMMIVSAQDKYMRNYDSGIDKDKVIVFNNSEKITSHINSVKADLLSIPGIDAVSFTNCMPTQGTRPTNEVSWEGKEANEKLHFWCISTDFDYNKIVNLKINKGRFFDKTFASDSESYLINDVAANVMKYNNPVGSSITVEGKKGTIIGTFSGFHAIDLSGPIVPTIIRLQPGNAYNMLVNFSSGTFSDKTSKITDVLKRYDSETIFQPRLFRQISEFSQLNVPAKLIAAAFIIALLLACLGLFGLASFTVESRTKEIGIRKTNGATIPSILKLLLSNYTKWLLIAILISLPLAFLLGNIFLGRFYFHTPMPFWAFILGPSLAYLIAILTVSGKSLRAATRNPVEALRYE